MALRLVPGEDFGRYRIEAEIGRGGQAVVYRATQLELDRQVALKVFDEGYLNRGGALERFRREAIAAGRLEHPRIVPVYDAGEADGRAYMSMRLIPGDSLAERIARNGPLPPAEAMAVLTDIGEAIDFAHARGTVHRDVKTANILLDPEGASYLSDFGLVRLDDMPGLTRRGDWLGTAEYVSPEQVEGEPATPGSDLYSLAVVAFEVLTGRPPFVRREPSATLLAHVRDPVPDASAVAHGLPPAVDEVLARGLAKDPRERPESAEELVEELRVALGSRVAQAIPVAAVTGGGGSRVTGDPWDVALAHFGGPGGGNGDTPDDDGPRDYVPVPDRLTQAFGDAARRRGLAMKRDVAIAAGIAAVVLLLTAGVGGWILGSSSADASGAKAEGYTAGVAAGKKAGAVSGARQGRIAGKKEGLAQGRRTGFAAGKKAGVAEGTDAGISQGIATGRASALAGLGSGWYVVQIGPSGIARSQPVATDASKCYAVSGGTVLSGPC